MPSVFQRTLRRLTHPLYKKLETDVHPLRYLFLEITGRCNLACRHCGSDCGRSPAQGELSASKFVAFIDQLATSFAGSPPFVVLSGGEPLCHPELPKILDALNRNRLRWGMVTNGWLLDEKTLSRLKRARMESITVSLDGAEASHDWLRGREGAFTRAHRAIALLAAANLPSFDVVTCVSPRIMDELPRVEEILRAAGVKKWRLFSIFPIGRAATDPELLLSAAELKRLFDWIAGRRKALEKTDFTIDFCCEGYLPPPVDASVRDNPYFCRAGINIGSVLSNGDISACPNISRSLVQGNIARDDFKTVWDTRYERFRDRRWMKKGPCESCSDWSKCQGNSMHLFDESRGHTCLCHVAAARGEELILRTVRSNET